MYLANKSVISEKGFCDTTPTTLEEPIFTFYNWSRANNKTAGALGNMHWPTIATSAITFYGEGAIPGWNYSLLIPSLKNGLFRLKLKSDGLSIDSTQSPTDTLHYLPGLRLRNITVAPTGDTLFVAVDNSCCSIDSAGTLGTSIASPANMGFILRMVYLKTLDLKAPIKIMQPESPVTTCKVYPNPAHKTLYVETPPGERKPLTAGLYDIAGKLLIRKETADNYFSLDVHGLLPGIYVFRLLNGYSVPLLTEKILIE
jgi:hypothetical protein